MSVEIENELIGIVIENKDERAEVKLISAFESTKANIACEKSLYYNNDMSLFTKKPKTKSYDHSTQIPAIRASICTGEQVAGFKDIHTGKFEEVMLLRNEDDLSLFRQTYGITGEIEKFY